MSEAVVLKSTRARKMPKSTKYTGSDAARLRAQGFVSSRSIGERQLRSRNVKVAGVGGAAHAL